MKTTVDLPEALVTEARRLARERRSTLRELIETGLRAEIERQRSGAQRRRLEFPTATGSGLRHGVDRNRLTDYAYDLPPEGS